MGLEGEAWQSMRVRLSQLQNSASKHEHCVPLNRVSETKSVAQVWLRRVMFETFVAVAVDTFVVHGPALPPQHVQASITLVFVKRKSTHCDDRKSTHRRAG